MKESFLRFQSRIGLREGFGVRADFFIRLTVWGIQEIRLNSGGSGFCHARRMLCITVRLGFHICSMVFRRKILFAVGEMQRSIDSMGTDACYLSGSFIFR